VNTLAAAQAFKALALLRVLNPAAAFCARYC